MHKRFFFRQCWPWIGSRSARSGGNLGIYSNIQERLKQRDDNMLARLLDLLESEKRSGALNQS